MLITEDVFVSGNGGESGYPIIKPNHYNIGYEIGKRLIADSGEKENKKAGIVFASMRKKKPLTNIKDFVMP